MAVVVMESLSLGFLLLTLVVAYSMVKAIQRLFFHPLSQIPGPWYAAVSTLYEFWWDCPKSGKYFLKIEEMHEKYGTSWCSLPSSISLGTKAGVSNPINIG